MKFKSSLTSCLVAAAALALLGGCSSGSKQAAKNPPTGQPTTQPEFKLPPGWTEADMQACMVAGTPGKEHERLLKDVGVWKGKNTMWHYPGAQPMVTEATCKVTNFMDGRYIRLDWSGDMPGMGPYKGFGLEGYDNVAQKYVNLWVDNMSTGLMDGTGELSADGSTITWNFDYICPITKKQSVFRQIEKRTGPNSKTLDMFGEDPKSGKEFKMMTIELTRK